MTSCRVTRSSGLIPHGTGSAEKPGGRQLHSVQAAHGNRTPQCSLCAPVPGSLFQRNQDTSKCGEMPADKHWSHFIPDLPGLGSKSLGLAPAVQE